MSWIGPSGASSEPTLTWAWSEDLADVCTRSRSKIATGLALRSQMAFTASNQCPMLDLCCGARRAGLLSD